MSSIGLRDLSNCKFLSAVRDWRDMWSCLQPFWMEAQGLRGVYVKVACMLVRNVRGKCKRECSSKPNGFLAIYDWSMHRHAHWLATPEHAPLRRTDRPGRFTGEPINVSHVVIFTLHNLRRLNLYSSVYTPSLLVKSCHHPRKYKATWSLASPSLPKVNSLSPRKPKSSSKNPRDWISLHPREAPIEVSWKHFWNDCIYLTFWTY